MGANTRSRGREGAERTPGFEKDALATVARAGTAGLGICRPSATGVSEGAAASLPSPVARRRGLHAQVHKSSASGQVGGHNASQGRGLAWSTMEHLSGRESTLPGSLIL